jgi:hypothetical protein
MSEAGNGDRIVGGYRLERMVGEGPHGEIFESTDNFGRRVEVHCYDGKALEGRLAQDDFFEAVRRTAAVAHESSCLMLEMGAEEDLWFVVFVAPDAPSLRQLLERGGGLAEERVRVAAEGAADALARLAAGGLRHGDLRPETVYLSGGRVFLSPPRLIPATVEERSAAYLAPEELRGEEGDIRSDLFTLGLVLREALSGRRAVPASSPGEALGILGTGLSPPPPEIAPEMAGLLSALAALDPDDRPSDPLTIPRVLAGEIRLSPPPVAAVAEAPPATGAAEAIRVPSRHAREARLVVPSSKGESLWEIREDEVWLSLDPEGYAEVAPEEGERALAVVRREPDGLVAAAVPDREPHLRVNGSLVDRHVLAPGDRLQLGDAILTFEEMPAPPRPSAPLRAGGRRKGDLAIAVGAVVLCLVVVTQAIVRWQGLRSEGEPEIREAEEIVARAEEMARAGTESAPTDRVPVAPVPPLEEDAAARRKAVALAAQVASAWRDVVSESDAMIRDDSVYDAWVLYRNFADDHSETRFGDRAASMADGLMEILTSRHEEDSERLAQAMAGGDFDVALALLDRIEVYGSPRMRNQVREKREEIRRHLQETQIPESDGMPPGPGPEVPGPDGPEAPPDPVPGAADDRLETRAERAFEAGSKAVLRQRWSEALRHLENLSSPPLAGTRFYLERQSEVERMLGLARLEVEGLAALFRGEVKKGRGREVQITYTFETAAEEEDWVFFNPFADPRSGRFDHYENTMRGRGVGALAHNAVFEPGTLEMEVRLQAVVPHDLGVIFLEPKNLVRFYLYSIQNRFFTIGAERARLDENVIWIFGGGAWADTPNAEIGFVRVAKSPQPEITGSEWLDLVATKTGDRVTMSIKRSAPLSGSALGDDRYEFPALRPGLYMLGSEMVVDKVVIRGVLDEGWAEGAMRKARERFK